MYNSDGWSYVYYSGLVVQENKQNIPDQYLCVQLQYELLNSYEF